MRNIISPFLMVILCVSATGCAGTKVTRVEVEEKIDLSGDWNDYDAMQVAQEMVGDCLERSWLKNFRDEHGRKPVVIIGRIANRTHEHIDPQIFVKHIERELLNSAEVGFVANPYQRESLRDEREDQEGFTSPESMAQIGKEKGADFMMLGSVHSVVDEAKNKSVVLYQVNMELLDLDTNEKVWIGQNQIKKKITKSKFSF